jgi:hypothetical protein
MLRRGGETCDSRKPFYILKFDTVTRRLGTVSVNHCTLLHVLVPSSVVLCFPEPFYGNSGIKVKVKCSRYRPEQALGDPVG